MGSKSRLLQTLVANGGANAVPTQGLKWRKGWDSNPRWTCAHAGFQDRFLKPLGHPSCLDRACLGHLPRRRQRAWTILLLARPAQAYLFLRPERHLWLVIGLPLSTGDMDMKKLLVTAALLSILPASAFAQAGTPQGDTIVPNPPHSASSNDMSRSPGAGMPSANTESRGMTTGSATAKHAKKHKKKSKTPAKGM